ncbi:MAG TPA: type II secretion system protein [Fimbriimonadaceae bacterium]|nr:type II secretion system protein [Fimbriimonadaceae bacterium]
MTRIKRAFTLPELLIVFAIIAILASLLFPVFRYVKAGAHKTQCISNFRQLQLVATLYVSDWDDRLMPVNHQPSAPANSTNDRTWVQLTLPYARTFSIYNCPSDYGQRPAAETTFDQDLVPGDTYSKYYSASLRVNAGYNYAYLAPVFQSANGRWLSDPRSSSSIADPSRTILFVDSLYGRTPTGQPFGGGSWLVVPPCRFEVKNGQNIDTFSIGNGSHIYAKTFGWDNDKSSPFLYGSAWPWHQGRMNLVRLDGSTVSIPADQLSTGCDVRENWQGVIRDSEAYMWDLN